LFGQAPPDGVQMLFTQQPPPEQVKNGQHGLPATPQATVRSPVGTAMSCTTVRSSGAMVFVLLLQPESAARARAKRT
jgi:hypothetical protein